MPNKEKILDRIKKLLARAQSNNEHEAALAASMAAELMTEHQIAQAELDPDVSDVEPITEEAIDSDGKRVQWKLNLVGGLAVSLGCKHFFTAGTHGHQARYYAVGPDSALATLRYMYRYLVGEVERLADQAYREECTECALSGVDRPSARAWKGSFRVACSLTIRARLTEQRAKTMHKAKLAGKSQALMVLDQQSEAITTFMRRKHPHMYTVGSSAGSRSRSGWQAGSAAGQSVHLGGGGPALGAGAKRLKN